MKQFLEFDLQLEEGPVFPLNQIIKGKLTLKPLQRLHVEYINYQLIAKAKKTGLLSDYSTYSTSSIILSKDIETNCVLSEFEPYRYTLNFRNNEIETYRGIHLDIDILLKVRVKLAKKATSTKEHAIVGKFSKKTKSIRNGSVLYRIWSLTFAQPNYDYHLSTLTDSLSLSLNKIWWSNLLTVGLFLGFIIYFLQADNILEIPFLPVIILTTIVGAIVLFYDAVFKMLGKFTMESEQLDTEAFLLKIHTDNWRYIKKMSVNYLIIEEMPTNSENLNVHKAILYRSQTQLFKSPKTAIVVKNKFPKDMLGTTSVYPTQIYWVAVVAVQSIWGFTFPYNLELVVKKKAKEFVV